ncbi:RICIN domain-containing protein [Streptomyces turgidiscabies]|uniref:RICIN domain-containing protein n=1 Tax=Streptomyces turgidiscabies TaxID=85558 RepID=UPI0027D7E49C|nr:RICIN domain-containing protein [Streptomyces turgidiscabies]
MVPARTSGYYQLVNVGNGWCADVKDASLADDAGVIQWPSTGGSNQDWQLLAL